MRRAKLYYLRGLRGKAACIEAGNYHRCRWAARPPEAAAAAVMARGFKPETASRGQLSALCLRAAMQNRSTGFVVGMISIDYIAAIVLKALSASSSPTIPACPGGFLAGRRLSRRDFDRSPPALSAGRW